MTDEKFNGWANYPTWCINMWLENDEGIYSETASRVAMVHDDEDNTYRSEVANVLQNLVEELSPDLGSSFPADLIGWVMSHVDWYEIADGVCERAEVSRLSPGTRTSFNGREGLNGRQEAELQQVRCCGSSQTAETI